MKLLFIFAILLYLSAIEALPQSRTMRSQLEPSWVYIGEAKRSINNGDVGHAIYMLQEVVIREPSNADAHYLLGLTYDKEAKSPNTAGGIASYHLAITHYNKSIEYAKNLTVPANEIDTYFRLLSIYEKLLNENKFEETEVNILRILNTTTDIATRGRIYFRLGEFYSKSSQNNIAIDNYQKAYQSKYRQKLSLFRMSLLYRKRRDYSKEKEILILASSYNFDFNEPGNIEVNNIITTRLEQLRNVRIKSNFY